MKAKSATRRQGMKLSKSWTRVIAELPCVYRGIMLWVLEEFTNQFGSIGAPWLVTAPRIYVETTLWWRQFRFVRFGCQFDGDTLIVYVWMLDDVTRTFVERTWSLCDPKFGPELVLAVIYGVLEKHAAKLLKCPQLPTKTAEKA